MKRKRFFSALLCLLLMLALAPGAFADEYCALGSFAAGEELDCLITTLPEEVTPEAENVPAGLWVEERQSELGPALFLMGTPTTAGSFQFAVTAGEAITCSLEVTPALPVVTVSDDVNCWVGSEVTLTATAWTEDTGVLSFQWYLEDGLNTRPLAGETGSFLRPDTSVPGVWRYCCEVTNSNGGLVSTVLSDLITLTVQAPNVSSVSIETMPTKMDYQVGDDFDPTGLSLRVIYDSGAQEIVTEGYDVSYSLFSTAGTHTVKVSYSGFSWNFYVNVEKKEAAVSGIGVLSLPTKREYLLGESLQTAGLSIRVYTDDGEHYDVSRDLVCSPTVMEKEGEQIITVKYAEKTCTFKVSVKNDKVITGISVLTLPNNRSYTVGDYLNTDGLTVQLNSNKGSELLTGGYTVSPKVLASPGTQEITVRYDKYTAKFNVTVKAKEAVTPTPRPTATPAVSPSAAPGESAAPASPGVSADPNAETTARPSPTPARKNTGVNAAVKVCFAVAVLALAALAGYVWYLRKNGFGEEEYAAPAAPADEPPAVYGEPVEPESTASAPTPEQTPAPHQAPEQTPPEEHKPE